MLRLPTIRINWLRGLCSSIYSFLISIAFFIWVGFLLPAILLTWLDGGFELGEGLLLAVFALFVGILSIFIFGLMTHKISLHLTPSPDPIKPGDAQAG